MKKYGYLVSYACQIEGYLGYSIGTSQIYTCRKIKSFDDIDGLTRDITESIDGVSNVTIFNFILLGKCNDKRRS